MAKDSDPPGEASTGYIWYQKSENGCWEESAKGNYSIGHGHSSYSAEAIAIWQGLDNDPLQDERMSNSINRDNTAIAADLSP